MTIFLKQWWLVLLIAGLITFFIVFFVCLLALRPSTPVVQRVHTECLDGFEYYVRSFRTQQDIGVALAPRWDRDGKPKRCPVESNKTGESK